MSVLILKKSMHETHQFIFKARTNLDEMEEFMANNSNSPDIHEEHYRLITRTIKLLENGEEWIRAIKEELEMK